MKMYVIKNKDGKILSWNYNVGRHFFDHYNLANLSNFSTFPNPKKAEYLNKKYKDTEIIELNLLTPSELADHDKQVRRITRRVNMEDWSFKEQPKRQLDTWEQAKLLIEIEEQEEKERVFKAQLEIAFNEYEKDIRKKVCEEIKKQIVYYPVSLLDEAGNVKDNVWGISMKDLSNILD